MDDISRERLLEVVHGDNIPRMTPFALALRAAELAGELATGSHLPQQPTSTETATQAE